MLLLARMAMATLGKSFRALGDTRRRTYVENKAPIMDRIVVKKLVAFYGLGAGCMISRRNA